MMDFDGVFQCLCVWVGAVDTSEDSMESSEEMVTPRAAASEADEEERKAGAAEVPVALAVENSMFYGTTASGWKGVDPFYYLANPRMCYTVEFLDRVDTAAVGEGKAASTDVANRVQRIIAAALGYECTMLTRKDKYLMLVGNDGAVAVAPPRRQR